MNVKFIPDCLSLSSNVQSSPDARSDAQRHIEADCTVRLSITTTTVFKKPITGQNLKTEDQTGSFTQKWMICFTDPAPSLCIYVIMFILRRQYVNTIASLKKKSFLCPNFRKLRFLFQETQAVWAIEENTMPINLLELYLN